jgi:prepilin-type N-terminal cleavage/methylation domain-containing protein
MCLYTVLFRFRLASKADIMRDKLTRAMVKNSYVQRAFTLIELIVVLAIIAILMSMVYPVFTGISERAKATKDMSNLRQIGLATQTYLNDTDGVFPGSGSQTWMLQLEQNQKYLSVWKILQSPFDKRSTSESGDATTAISYGINSKVYDANNVPISAEKITKPTVFVLFAAAQVAGATVGFSGTGASGAPGVKVLGIGGNQATSTPGGNAIAGTQNNRTKINALFADLHSETMPWATFTNNAQTGNDPDGAYRWSPQGP